MPLKEMRKKLDEVRSLFGEVQTKIRDLQQKLRELSDLAWTNDYITFADECIYVIDELSSAKEGIGELHKSLEDAYMEYVKRRPAEVV